MCTYFPAGDLGRSLQRFMVDRKHAIAVPERVWSVRELLMSSTFDIVAKIISETCDIPRETIKPESHINDLGIDSLDFRHIAFSIDKTFGIKLPLEQWIQEVDVGKATTEQYFQLNNLCSLIDKARDPSDR
jgi:acyl carrier protein